MLQLFSFLSSIDDASIAEDVVKLQSVLPDNMRFEMLKMIGSLVLLLGVFGFGVWLFKRFARPGGRTIGSSSIKILDRRVLTPKTTLYLIKVVNKVLVIADNSERTTLLTEFPPDTDIRTLLQQDSPKPSTKTSDLLANVFPKLQGKKRA